MKGVLNFTEKIPPTWLPSFHGKFAHFKTKLCIELVTKGRQKVEKIWASIRVEPAHCPGNFFEYYSPNSSAILQRTNPFTPKEHYSEESHPGPTYGLRLCPIHARISDGNGEIAKISLPKSQFQPGNSIIGLVDFQGAPSGSRICCQLIISLVSVEKSDSNQHRIVHKIEQENCFGTDALSFSIEVPHNATTSFVAKDGKSQTFAYE